MPLVDILGVTISHSSDVSPLAGCSIDLPRPNSHCDLYEIEVAGWALGPDGPPEAIELIHRNQTLRKAALDIPRLDVAKVFPDIPNADRSGFCMSCGVTGFDTEFELEVTALFGANTRVRLGTIRGRHEPVHSKFQPTLRPLMLTSLGRTGT